MSGRSTDAEVREFALQHRSRVQITLVLSDRVGSIERLAYLRELSRWITPKRSDDVAELRRVKPTLQPLDLADERLRLAQPYSQLPLRDLRVPAERHQMIGKCPVVRGVESGGHQGCCLRKAARALKPALGYPISGLWSCWVRLSVWLVCLGFLCAGCGSEPPAPTEPPPPPPKPKYSPPLSARFIEPLIFIPYTRADFPETFAKWGPAGARRINALRIAAAERVIIDERCNRVDGAELSPRSQDEPIIFVDCQNGLRAMLRASELDDMPSPRPTDVTRESAVSLCEDAASAHYNEWMRPATLTFARSEAFLSKTLGTWMVRMTHQAKGANFSIGDTDATCSVDPLGEAVIWNIVEW